MDTDGQSFLNQLANSSGNGFAVRFSRISTRLGLGVYLNGNEMSLLYEAAFYATLCNIAFNGLGGCGGMIKREKEQIRIGIEREFMAARDKLRASAGWKGLMPSQKESVRNIFLRVAVREDKLA
jgi:hypothetical protein